jgi:hypothetical protein
LFLLLLSLSLSFLLIIIINIIIIVIIFIVIFIFIIIFIIFNSLLALEQLDNMNFGPTDPKDVYDQDHSYKPHTDTYSDYIKGDFE